jgi:hypothetical protein
MTRKETQDVTSFISAAMFLRVSSPSPMISKPSSCRISLRNAGLVTPKFSHPVEVENGT